MSQPTFYTVRLKGEILGCYEAGSPEEALSKVKTHAAVTMPNDVEAYYEEDGEAWWNGFSSAAVLASKPESFEITEGYTEPI